MTELRFIDENKTLIQWVTLITLVTYGYERVQVYT
ncbi:hypothetical protein ING2E5B_1506 [Fermentimonas caenicola]|jgi:hypothetical protein|uniref:Uncharacterized protein n=1 Tax=Fermentimonas caenicola TaxID=1562970 RepID=A0A098C009_9BACT|nr:hypothetical protein ING2E5B_1506 [Fermentimonas caenicola]